MTLLIASLAILIAGSANAQGTCEPLKDITERLAKFDEHPIITGIVGTGVAYAIQWVSPARTWTWTVTKPDDETCIVAFGTDLMISGNVPEFGKGM